jgi:hypothetical protein
VSYEDERQCLTRSLERTAAVLGFLVVVVIGAVIVAVLMT